jgi:hypothetical protein
MNPSDCIIAVFILSLRHTVFTNVQYSMYRHTFRNNFQWEMGVSSKCAQYMKYIAHKICHQDLFFIYVCLSAYLSTRMYIPLLDLGHFFSFLIFFTQSVGGISPSQGRSGHRTEQTRKCTQTSMPQVGFELTIPVFQRTNTFHALARAATLIGTVFVSWVSYAFQ